MFGRLFQSFEKPVYRKCIATLTLRSSVMSCSCGNIKGWLIGLTVFIETSTLVCRFLFITERLPFTALVGILPQVSKGIQCSFG